MMFSALILITLSPLYTFIWKLFAPDEKLFFPHVIDYITEYARAIGLISLIIMIRGIVREKKSIKKILRDHIPQVLMALFALYIVLSCLLRGLSFWDWHIHGILLHENALSFVTYGLVFFVCASMIKEERYKLIAVNLYIAVFTIMGFIAMYAYYVSPIRQFKETEGIGIVFNQFNYYGYYLTMGILLCAVMFIRQKGSLAKYIYALCFLFNSYILVVNNTFGCYLAVLTGLIFIIIASRIIDGRFSVLLFMPLLGFIAVSIFCSFFESTILSNFLKLYSDVGSIAASDGDAGEAGTGRWKLWMETIQLIKEKPLLGQGSSMFSRRMMFDLHTEIVRTHNEILQYAGWFGIPTSIFYVAGVFAVYIKAIKNRAHFDTPTLACLTAAFGYFVSAFFGLTLYSTAPYFFFFLALGIVRKPEPEPAAESQDAEQEQSEPAQETPGAEQDTPEDEPVPETVSDGVETE